MGGPLVYTAVVGAGQGTAPALLLDLLLDDMIRVAVSTSTRVYWCVGVVDWSGGMTTWSDGLPATWQRKPASSVSNGRVCKCSWHVNGMCVFARQQLCHAVKACQEVLMTSGRSERIRLCEF